MELSWLQILVLVAITYKRFFVWAEVENVSVWTAVDHGSVGTNQQMNRSYSVCIDSIGLAWESSYASQYGRTASAIDELVQQSSTMLRRVLSWDSWSSWWQSVYQAGESSLLSNRRSSKLDFRQSKCSAKNGSMWSHHCFQRWRFLECTDSMKS